MKKKPLVSIIIPTKNASAFLASCLISLKRQSYKLIEIIVVDNFSTDDTFTIARRFTKKVIKKGPERSAQRNFGAKMARGEYIAWFDVDMKLTPKVIEECVQAVTKSKLHALVIPERSIGRGFWAKCRILEKQCYLNDEHIEAVRFVKKKTYFNVGQMSPNFISGEDWDITSRLKQKKYLIGRIKSFVIHNEGELSLINDLKKKYYYATKSLPYINRHVNSPVDLLRFIIRPAYLRNWRLLLQHPTLTFGLIVMKALEFGVGGFGVLRAKYEKR